MASKLRSLAKTYASLKGRGSSTSHLSSYAKSLSVKNRAAEDKVIDDNFANGLISTSSYLTALNDRFSRNTLTPVQRETLRIKISDVEQKYTDEQIQTAYQTGGFFNGSKVDDNFMLNYEKNKLVGMDASSTAYEQQSQKVATIQDRIDKEARSMSRIQQETDLANSPDYDWKTLEEKAKMYKGMAEQALQDGDNVQAARFNLSAINASKEAQKAKANFDVSNEINAATQNTFNNKQDIARGGSGASSSVPAGNGTPSGNNNGLPEQGPTQGNQPGEENVPIDPDSVDWGNIEQYYTEKELRRFNNIGRSVSAKQKEIANYVENANNAAEDYNTYMTASEKLKGIDKDSAKSYADRAAASKRTYESNRTAISNAQEELAASGAQASLQLDDLNKSVAYRIVGDFQNYLDLKKARADSDFKLGNISKNEWLQLTGDYNAASEGNLEYRRDLAKGFGDSKTQTDAETAIADIMPKIKQDLVSVKNPDMFEGVVDPMTGIVNKTNVSKDKMSKDSEGVTAFSKLYQQEGNAYVPVTYYSVDDQGKFQPMTDAEVSSTNKSVLSDKSHVRGITKVVSEEDIQKNPALANIEPGSVITEIYRGKDNRLEQVRSDVGDVLYSAPAEQKPGFLQGVGNFINSAVNWVGDNLLQDKQNTASVAPQGPLRNFFNGTLFGPGAQEGTSSEGQGGLSLRSIEQGIAEPFTVQKIYAQEAGNVGEPTPTIANVPDAYAADIMAAAEKYGVSPSTLAGLLEQESGFDPSADNGYDRGIAQINRSAHPEVSDEQAFNPKFAIDWTAKEISSLTKQTGSEYDALRAYNGGLSGYPNVPSTKNYADSVLTKAKNHVVTSPSAKPAVEGTSTGLRSQAKLTSVSSMPGSQPVSSATAPELRSKSNSGGSNVVQKASKAVKDTMDKVKNNPVSKAIDSISTPQKAADTVLRSAVSAAPKAVKTALNVANTVNNVKNAVGNTVNKVKNTVSDVVDKAKKKASSVVGGIRSFFKI